MPAARSRDRATNCPRPSRHDLHFRRALRLLTSWATTRSALMDFNSASRQLAACIRGVRCVTSSVFCDAAMSRSTVSGNSQSSNGRTCSSPISNRSRPWRPHRWASIASASTTSIDFASRSGPRFPPICACTAALLEICKALGQTAIAMHRRGVPPLSVKQPLSPGQRTDARSVFASRSHRRRSYTAVRERNYRSADVADRGLHPRSFIAYGSSGVAADNMDVPTDKFRSVRCGFSFVPRCALHRRAATHRRSPLFRQAGAGDTDAETVRAGDQRTLRTIEGIGDYCSIDELTNCIVESFKSRGAPSRAANGVDQAVELLGIGHG